MGAVLRGLGASRLSEAERRRAEVVADSERAAETIRREAEVAARESALALRSEIERELERRREDAARAEERLRVLEGELDRRGGDLQRREQGVNDREIHVRALQQELGELRHKELRELERVAGLSQAAAKEQLVARSEDEIRHELARRVRALDEEAAADARRRARSLVANALQRVAASHAAETTVSLIELPSDDMKGRIIGREGRNIRTLEHLTGVDIIIDETPNAVVLSSFDGLRREIARLTLEKLLEDGRIHPARIEEMYERTRAELEEHVLAAGQQAAFEANCGEVPEEIARVLGRLKYRTSYGQNVLAHTLEVVHLAGLMAAELGASVRTARRAALLHDIGKALTHEAEGSHAAAGAALARRHGESAAVVHAIEAHHYEVQPQTVEAVLVIAADAISASRPGARGESLESYVKRLHALEEIAQARPGVEKVYALQAGREVRVIVRPDEIDDDATTLLSHEIAREIEGRLDYPAPIKVTVIRESRSVDFARQGLGSAGAGAAGAGAPAGTGAALRGPAETALPAGVADGQTSA